MEDFLSMTALAKARIDNGLSQLGYKIDSSDPVSAALVLFAGRAVASSNAVALLIAHGHEIEAVPILRILGELAVWMRWISEKDGPQRAREALAEIAKPEWQSYWAGERLAKRAEHFGFDPDLRDALLGFSSAHFHSKTGHIPWDHIFQWDFAPAPSARQEMRAAGLFLMHVLEAMNTKWPGRFEGYKEIRAKYEKDASPNGGEND